MRLNIFISATAALVLAFTDISANPAYAFDSSDANQTPAAQSVIDKYLDARKVQQAALQGAQMEMDIEAKLPKLGKRGTLRALRFMSKLGKITFKQLGFTGDETVKEEVIARYLALERDAHDDSQVGVTPENYKFRLTAKLTQGENRYYIFHLTPRKKRVGLFKGEIWLDADSGMPVKESGQWVKSPSVFIKKVQFEQDYAMQDGVAVPSHIHTTVDTRIAGKAELSVNFSNYTRASEDPGNSDIIVQDSSGQQ